MPRKRTARLAVLLSGLAALTACAQSPTDAHKERPMAQQADPSITAMNEAAKAAEREHDARRLANSNASAEPAERHDAMAPTIPVAELRARILRLTASLHVAADTEAEHVGRIMGVSFAPTLLAIKEGDSVGTLSDLGPYRIDVVKVGGNVPGKYVDISFQPPAQEGSRSKVCTFDFASFAGELTAQGYNGADAELPHREQWGFVRYSKTANLTFYVAVEIYRADDGTEDGKQCVTVVRFGAERGSP